MSADLTVMGKVIGGGLPAAAVGGRGRADADARPRRARSTRRARCRATRSPSRPGWRPSSCSTSPPTLRLAATTERLAEGLREGRRRLPGPGAERHRPADRVLQRAPGDAPSRTPRPATWRPTRLVPGAARARRLPAAVAVRGLVPLAGPRRRADRAHARGGRGRLRRAARAGAQRVSVAGPRGCCGVLLRERRGTDGRAARRRRDPLGGLEAAGEAGGARRRGAARGGPPRGVRAAGRGDLRGLPAALRRRRASSACPMPTSACWPATGSTRSASPGWSRSATPRPSPSSPTRSRSARWPRAPATRELAEAVWDAGARAVGWGSERVPQAAKELVRRGLARGARGDAHKCRSGPGVALNRASILLARRWPTSTSSTSPSTRSTGASRAPSRARPSPAGAS